MDDELEQTGTSDTAGQVGVHFARAIVAQGYNDTVAQRLPAVGHTDRHALDSSSLEPADGSARVDASGRHAVDFADLGKLGGIDRGISAANGWRGLASRLGFSVRPGAREQQARELEFCVKRDEEVIRQATWTRATSILVANPKGGVGKTPSALLLGGVLSAIRGGSVCVLEVSDDPGALSYRAEGSPSLGLGELVRDIESVHAAGQLAGYTAPQTSFASVIGTVGRRPRLTGDDVMRVALVIDQFYSMRVMDSGNQTSSSAFRGALSTADALVVPVYNAGDAAVEAIALLDDLRSQGGHASELADSATVLRLSDGRPETEAVTARLDSILDDAVIRNIVDIPYDSHIAERGQLTLASLAAPTRRAFIGAAATVVRTLQAAPR